MRRQANSPTATPIDKKDKPVKPAKKEKKQIDHNLLKPKKYYLSNIYVASPNNREK